MRGTVQKLDMWEDPNHNAPDLAYLDACDWELFLDWLAEDDERIRKLVRGAWRVRLFNSQVSRYFGSNGPRTKRLRDVGLALDKTTAIRQSDDMFVNEAQYIYFGNEPHSQRRAETLVLARRQAPNGNFSIISQHRGFWRIPLVDVYYIDEAQLVGQNDLPAEFDFLTDFAIHREFELAVQAQLDTGEAGQVLLDALIALRDLVRVRSGLREDGVPLMQRAFKEDGSNLKLNPLSNPDPRGSQRNEQKGFKEIYCGAMQALRNPITHEGANSQFTRDRLQDRRTLYKYLSFLSILFERADAPMLS